MSLTFYEVFLGWKLKLIVLSQGAKVKDVGAQMQRLRKSRVWKCDFVPTKTFTSMMSNVWYSTAEIILITLS